MNRDNELIRRGDVRAAIASEDVVRCVKCGGSRKNHHFRHMFSPDVQFDLRSAIDALPAVTAPTLAEALAVPEVKALVEFVQEVRRNGDGRLASMAIANLAQVGKY